MKKNTIIFSLVFVLLIAVGILLNAGIKSEKFRIDEEKLLELMPSQEPDRIEAVEFTPSEEETRVIKKYKAYKDDKLVGYIYIGETKGYSDGLQIAYAINSKNHKVTGAKIVQSNETPRFVEALANSNFYKQFKNVDFTIFNIKLTRVTVSSAKTSATPNGSNKDPKAVIAPHTTDGFERLLYVVRQEYAKDNKKFVMPSGLVVLSKDVDYTNINQFNYVFKDEADDSEVQAVIDKDYNIVSLSDESKRDAVLEALSNTDNQMVDWIVSADKVGTVTTLVIHAKAYSTTYATATVTIDNGTITNVDLKYSVAQSYEENPGYNSSEGNYDNAQTQLLEDTDIKAITGATETYRGLHAIQTIIRGYMEANHE